MTLLRGGRKRKETRTKWRKLQRNLTGKMESG
nr:MAG TPA: hypothetical protein [Caudoviricetes sp.]